ncbi:hypothetical protein RR48_08963 [Papilio machaon]|uniref:Uncharacterized protein n=1 Tax=Papilio machaon TaxID=76193 RepID=A0A194QXN8_PAPMA|nr:hypothetical protein RR48_08963 [Papilio machaon]
MSKRKLENNDFDDLWKKFKEFEKEIAQAQAQRTRHRQHRSDSRLEVPPLLPSRSRSQSPEPSSSSVASSSSSSCSQRGRETPPTRSSLAGLPPPHTPSQEPSRYEVTKQIAVTGTRVARLVALQLRLVVLVLVLELLAARSRDATDDVEFGRLTAVPYTVAGAVKIRSQGLADTLKAAKTISKSGADLKQSISTQQTQKKTDKGKNHLNWRASLPHHRQSTRPAPPPPPPPPPTAPRVPPRAHR